MKAVLMSIQPKWCELIASGKKTIEVRKNRPKLETPFKCYIYATKPKKFIKGYADDDLFRYVDERIECGFSFQLATEKGATVENNFLSGKVIGEFVCDRIYGILPHNDGYDVNQYGCGWKYGEDDACLTFDEYKKYLGANNGYGWHISDLKIYDKPRELGEFKPVLSDRDIRCKYILKPYNPYGKQIVHCTLQKCYCEFHSLASQTDCCGYEPLKEIRPLTRPPQSWCYVEE